ncbi:N-acetyltransferase [Kocuria coralli]|uniref:N-acetyltransferase n=1 Tax=Kocuria coralli TaxID=1461025 RepID=A0A5J5KZI3_9MICC|nr:GNAT family N-acetyltransferase [Kocuria coralli]KAA9394256.1 N-acetyltransferase [Kocuria coralli]
MTQNPEISLQHNAERNAIELFDGDQKIGEVDYLEAHTPDGAAAWNMVHTGVRPQHRNRGLASQLVRFAMETAREHDRKVIPSCPYIQVWLRKNPDYQDLTS